MVRRVRPGDWRANRALRLEALADYPLGFLETLKAARALDDDAWRARAARGAVGGDSIQVHGWLGDVAVGTCVGFVDTGVAWLAGVYISPPHRGRGLLERLVAACEPWVREQGAREWLLEVHEDNPRARRAYERLGWTATAATVPYPLPPYGFEREMRRAL